MDKLADEYKEKAGFYYADIEDGGINTGSAAGIRGVPTGNYLQKRCRGR
jgi:thioredoxin 1